MQVAIGVEQLLAPVPGGTGRYSRELAAALARRGADGDSVASWSAWHRNPAAAVIDGVTGPARLPAPRRALAELWSRGVGPRVSAGDVVHAPTLLVPPRSGPLVVTVHDAVPWTHPETLTPRGVRWHRRMGERVASQADVVIAPTQATADELARHLRLRRVEVVGEGMSAAIEELPVDADERASRLGLPPSYALVVGTLEPRKGVDVALAALADRRWPDGLPLLVVGPSGWGGVEVRADAGSAGKADKADRADRADRAGKAGTVRTLGRLADADLAVAYARASVVLTPSRSEGFGLPVLEAMWHGRPVVVSDVPALVEVGGDAVVIVPTGDAAALADGVAQALARAEELAEQGRRRAASMTWDAAADRCWEIYRSLA